MLQYCVMQRNKSERKEADAPADKRAWVDQSADPNVSAWAVIQEGVETKWFKTRGEAQDECDRRNKQTGGGNAPRGCKCDNQGSGQYHLPGCELHIGPSKRTRSQQQQKGNAPRGKLTCRAGRGRGEGWAPIVVAVEQQKASDIQNADAPREYITRGGVKFPKVKRSASSGQSAERPVCPNCGQWQNPHVLGGVDCVNDCVGRGFAPRAASEAPRKPRRMVCSTTNPTGYQEIDPVTREPIAAQGQNVREEEPEARVAVQLREQARRRADAQAAPQPQQGADWQRVAIRLKSELDRARAQCAELLAALKDLRDVCDRIGAPPITQGGLCEEWDWANAMQKSFAAIANVEGRAQ